MRKTKVLLITSMPWREDNNIGNSYSNLFGDIDDFEIAHIYCRDGEPYNSKVTQYFQISENRLAKQLFKKSIKTGKAFYMDASNNENDQKTSKTYNRLRILRWELFFIFRDLLWGIGNWKTKELYDFIDNFNPDIIFATLTNMPNINIMINEIHNKYHKPIILYSWDDVYSFKHYSYNPLFWIRKLYQRHYIRKTVKKAALLYTITNEMKEEYSNYFNKDCKLLYKSYNFSNKPKTTTHIQKPYKLVFMGNMGAGRWIALAELAKVLTEINKCNPVATLDIYSLSPRSKEMENLLNIEGTSKLMDKAPQNKIMDILQNADILIHVEPINKRDASFYRLSFSTKIVDYLYNAKCIIGIGRKTATLSYIEKNDAGIVFYDTNNMKEQLIQLFNNPSLIIKYGENAWNCGVKNHKREIIKHMLKKDFSEIANL